ncbi:uncharacterized protein LOC100679944 isoform X1 [Nasonia vitripennis]|uniref:Uncharacterized protein n=1 Tax=Nasonia vitripennis TaxID=7425 RepID=A0A7M7R1B8_NASVI|nr:uncharacterized protein LOC100679944 isoform X1 [Nasonia vitripennis]XP_031785137.1 uncharacterized protein LOC100679944 isoform X1 [Nasonia vitripennis]XP_032455846.1 uncharacterized protein LOC100679944 isoform X1 [Nasonia vitripennis]XP_032455847.1 uncharacterized protein LOC100679944 isoform X1 [Nasonia vitripennis]
MPGIHVRSLSRLHWENRDKEPALTVPGSYWLCHKNNIYKFTFKFHKTIRNLSHFTYSKELMKIIRRVIKWQPRQGQHFSTKNLLVTYNHASWTRQDKMFAVMKFCDRPDANAFPHAFILTVKIINQEVELQQTEQTMGSTAAKPDSENPPECVSDAFNVTPSVQPLLENSPKEGEVNGDESTPSIESTNGYNNKKDEDVSWSPRTRLRLKQLDSQGSLNITEKESPAVSQVCVEATNGTTQSLKIQGVELGVGGGSSNNGSITMRDMDCNSQSEPSVRSEMPITLPQRLDISKSCLDDDEDSKSSSGSQSDSASLPYQYLIERDIERELQNSKNNSKSCSFKENDSTSANVSVPVNTCDSSLDGTAENDSKSSKDSRKSSGKLRSRQDSKDSEPAPPDVANLRSSDITDLVMKGLMFTIRQDKDTVTVVEQKTKLEVDEVLENSEKVETKEGDPCLLNSSLLWLEKMITRMQEPPASLPEQSHNGLPNALVSFIDLTHSANLETEEKLNEADTAEKKEVCQNTAALETANCWSQFFPDKDISDSTFHKIEKALGDSSMYLNDEDGIDDMELRLDDEEEEDIIPEALVHNSLFDGALDAMSKTPSSMEAFEDLLMDDMEPNEDVIVDEVVTKLSTISRPSSALSLNENNLGKDSPKLSKIKVISNQIITNDQIPPALLKALKSKQQSQSQNGSVKSSSDDSSRDSLKSNNEINIKHIEPVIETSANIIVENNNVTEVKDVNELSVDAKVEVMLKKLKKSDFENYKTSKSSSSVSNQEIRSKPSSAVDISNDKSSHKTTSSKNSHKSNSNITPVDNIRLTRSNSKLNTKSNEQSTSSISNENTFKTECSVETRAQRTSENSSSKLNENIENKPLLRKRKSSTSDPCATKFFESVNKNGIEKKDVRIKVWKLINDISYGVTVRVERLDMKKIRR